MTNSEKVLSWRQRTKQRMVDAFSGSCGICKYDFYNGALEFHHLESDNKEQGIAKMIVNPAAWSKIVKELRKCVCLCSRCHKEVHAGVTLLPVNIPRFEESFSEYRKVFEKEMDKCPVCGTNKPTIQKTCSYKCAAKTAYKYDWNSFDLKSMYVDQKISQSAIAKLIGCSDVAVRKRLIKLGLKIF